MYSAGASDSLYPYSLGGRDAASSIPTDSFWRYDPSANTRITLSAQLPISLMKHSATILDGRIYVFPGETSDGFDTHVYVYDIAANAWDTITPTHTAPESVYHTAATFQGRLYRLGGQEPGFLYGTESAEAWVFNPETSSWSLAALLNEARCFHVSAVLDAIYVAGGSADYDWYEETWLTEWTLA